MMKPSASASNLSVPLVAKQYHYTVDCDLRHKRSSPEDPSDDVFNVSEEKEEVEERPRKRMRVLGETDSEDEGKEGLDGTSEKDISKEEIEDNINRLTRLIEPLDKIKKDTSLFKDTLRRDHFNADFQPCVLKIENNIQELYMQLVKCRSFYSFLLDAQRPVQAEWGYFGMLPPELLLKIFSFLDGKDLAIAQCTCTFFRKVGSDESLWKTICESLWSQDIALGQKPANKPWRWLFDCKMVRTSIILLPHATSCFEQLTCWHVTSCLTCGVLHESSTASSVVKKRTGVDSSRWSTTTCTRASGRRISATDEGRASWPTAGATTASGRRTCAPALASSAGPPPATATAATPTLAIGRTARGMALVR